MIEQRIPIIILNWKGLKDTKECLTSVLKMEGQPYEVILVDNGSGEEEQKKLKHLYGDVDEITLVLNDENKGFTRGNSDIVAEIMAREVVPPYVALLNNDTVVTRRWIKCLVESAMKADAHVVSSKMINYFDRSKIDNVGHFMLNTGEILPLGHSQDSKGFNEPKENLGACGGAVLYDTQMIRDIGFFDPFFDTGYEDAEYGLRAKLLGYKCLYAPEAVIYHKISQSIKKIMDDKYLQRVQINIFYTFFKLMPLRFIWINLPIVILKYIMWFLTGFVALQWHLLGLHIKTVTHFISKDLKVALRNRKIFFQKYDLSMPYAKSVINPTVFFLGPDVKRMIARLKGL